MLASRILILDDDYEFRARVREGLGGMFRIEEAGSEEGFWEVWALQRFDLLLLDMRLSQGREGMDVLRRVFFEDELQPVIMVSAYGDTESAIEAVGAGAMMFLHKSEFTPALLGRMAEAVIEQGRLRRQIHSLRQLAWRGEPDTLLGDNAAVREAAKLLREAAEDRSRVPLILGERGCGASLAAHLIHRGGDLPDGPFLEVAANLLDSAKEFFEGRLAPWMQANGGTLALDGAEELGVATGRSLLEKCDENTSPRVVFLLHEFAAKARANQPGRNVIPRWLAGDEFVPIRLPPLRERREDIPLLATHFLQRQRAGGHTSARSITGASMARLEGFPWPGNVRELRNAVEFAALQASARGLDEVMVEHLPGSLAGGGLVRGVRGSASEVGWDYRLYLARTELELADRAIRERGIAQKTVLAKALGYTDRFTLMRRIRKALRDFPALGDEFTAVANLFREGGTR